MSPLFHFDAPSLPARVDRSTQRNDCSPLKIVDGKGIVTLSAPINVADVDGIGDSTISRFIWYYTNPASYGGSLTQVDSHTISVNLTSPDAKDGDKVNLSIHTLLKPLNWNGVSDTGSVDPTSWGVPMLVVNFAELTRLATPPVTNLGSKAPLVAYQTTAFYYTPSSGSYWIKAADLLSVLNGMTGGSTQAVQQQFNDFKAKVKGMAQTIVNAASM